MIIERFGGDDESSRYQPHLTANLKRDWSTLRLRAIGSPIQILELLRKGGNPNGAGEVEVGRRNHPNRKVTERRIQFRDGQRATSIYAQLHKSNRNIYLQQQTPSFSSRKCTGSDRNNQKRSTIASFFEPQTQPCSFQSSYLMITIGFPRQKEHSSVRQTCSLDTNPPGGTETPRPSFEPQDTLHSILRIHHSLQQ